MSSADIRKSATAITFSNTSLLLTQYFVLKWNIGNVAFSTSLIASRKWCVNMVFSVDDKVLIKSLYQSATVVKRWFWLYILVTCVTFHQVNSFIDCMFYMYCSFIIIIIMRNFLKWPK